MIPRGLPGFWLCCLPWVLGLCVSVRATDIVISGSGGTEAYHERFRDWSSRLYRLLVEELGHSPEKVLLFQQEPSASGLPGQASQLENLRRAFARLTDTHSEREDLFLYLIGHGSYLRERSRFQIPGRDLTAAELADLLDGLPARHVVVIQAASASAAFINALSKKNRIICTATKSVSEQNATEFMEFFLQGLEDGSADRNRDERISVWEACEQAASLTESWYLGQGLIPTEHAILDDNGDDRGTRLLLVETGAPHARDDPEGEVDGALARTLYLKDLVFPDRVPRELVSRYLALIEEVERLKARKSNLAVALYYQQLESRLVAAARLRQRIRNLVGEAEGN